MAKGNALKGLFGSFLVVLALLWIAASILGFILSSLTYSFIPQVVIFSTNLWILLGLGIVTLIVGAKLFWDNTDKLIPFFAFVLGIIILFIGAAVGGIGFAAAFSAIGLLPALVILFFSFLIGALGSGLIEYSTGIPLLSSSRILSKDFEKFVSLPYNQFKEWR